ncbi:MAG: glycosyltransferase family 4 protein [Anaerolineae bacterium]
MPTHACGQPGEEGQAVMNAGQASPLRVLSIAVSDRAVRYSHVHPVPGWGKRGIHRTQIVYLPHDSQLRAAAGCETELHLVHARSKPAFLRDAVQLGCALHAQNPFDVVMAADPMGAGWVGLQLKRRLGLPLVIEVHTQYFGHLAWLFERPYYVGYRLLAPYLLRRADRVCTVSQAVADSLVSLGVPASRIRVAPTPLRTWLFGMDDVDVERPFRNRLLYVGYLVRGKGLATLLRAMRLLVDRGYDPQLDLVGEGPERRRLERLIAALGLRERVTFHGYTAQNQLAPHYRACDVFVLPTRYEAFGMVLVEAALCGAPVVASRVGGVPEAVRDGETALLVPPDDPSSLAAAIARLLDDPGRARAMGLAGFRWARKAFDYEAMMDRRADVVRWAVMGPGEAPC